MLIPISFYAFVDGSKIIFLRKDRGGTILNERKLKSKNYVDDHRYSVVYGFGMLPTNDERRIN